MKPKEHEIVKKTQLQNGFFIAEVFRPNPGGRSYWLGFKKKGVREPYYIQISAPTHTELFDDYVVGWAGPRGNK